MNMSTPHAVKGRKGRGRSPKNLARPHSGAPVRMTNNVQVLRKGGRGKKRGGRR